MSYVETLFHCFHLLKDNDQFFLPPLVWLVWSGKNNVTQTCAAQFNCTGSCLGENGLTSIKCCVMTLALPSKLLHNAEAYCDLESCVHHEIVDVNSVSTDTAMQHFTSGY